MKDLSLHHASANQLRAVGKTLPHAVLLAGPAGVGLSTVAHHLAKPFTKHPLVVTPDEKGTITIETVRELYTKTRAKQTSRQVVIIDDADAMSLAAQNAFLKLLEEPAQHTSFILTTHAPDRLLDTIRSRAQLVSIQPLTPKQTEEYLDNLSISNPHKRRQLLFIASGLPAELFRLVKNEEYFETQASFARKARDFLSSSPYKRLILSYQIGNDREEAQQLLDHIARMLKYSLQAHAKPSLALQLEKTLETAERINANAHVRTQLLRLALNT